MKEYERSLRVKAVQPYLDYCRKNGYKEHEAVSQNRVVYESKNCDHIIARITTDKVDGKEKIIFDFKNVNNKDNILKVSEESLPMEIRGKESLKIVHSMLDVLEFQIKADNYRVRYTFEKNNVKFEIDDYSKPEMCVVAIEGDENEVDAVYKDVVSKTNQFIEWF